MGGEGEILTKISQHFSFQMKFITELLFPKYVGNYLLELQDFMVKDLKSQKSPSEQLPVSLAY